MASYKVDIYKLICEDDPEFLYVGSTKNWRSRKAEHKSYTVNEKDHRHNMKLYQEIRVLGGWDKIKMVLIEHYECQSKREAEAREQYHIEQLKPNRNGKRAFLTIEQKVEQKRSCNKHWYEANKEQIIACECGAVICRNYISKHCKTKAHKDWVALVGI